MNTIELLKELRTRAFENGENMSLKTAKDILKWLIDSKLVDKDPSRYGELKVKIGIPEVK